MSGNFAYKIEDVSKRPSPRSRALRKVKAFVLRNARGFIELALAVILSLSGSDAYAISPLAPAAVCACSLYGSMPFFALAGTMIGTLLTRRYATLCACALYCGVALLLCVIKDNSASIDIVTRLRTKLRPVDKLLCLVGVQLALLPFFFFESVDSCAVGLAATLISVALAAVLARGAHALDIFLTGRRLNSINLVSFAVSLSIVIFALAGIRLFLSPAVILALTLSLAAASARRFAGVGTAALFALSAVVKGGSIEYTALISACAIGAAALSRGGRWAVAAGAAVIWGGLNYVFSLPSQTLLEASAGIMLFTLIPKRYILRLRHERDITLSNTSETSLALTREKLLSAAGVLDEVCALFATARDDALTFTHHMLSGASAVMKKTASDPVPSLHPKLSYRVGACAKAKHGSIETGDSVGIRESGTNVLLILSDGMGTGSAAHRESSAAVAMLGDLFCVGFDLNSAQECVNRLLVLKREHDMYATLDTVRVDLVSGVAEFIKQGAPPSYILREGKIYTIYSEALPMGIVSSAPPSLHTVTLERGDSVIMITDGVCDALGESVMASIAELVSAANTADDAASAVLLEAARDGADDDMTVLVLRIT